MSQISLILKGVSDSIGKDNVTNMIESNLKSYYDWALLAYMGAWTKISVPTSGIYGADFSRLRPVNDPNYSNGQVWEAAKKDFVWETGVNYVASTGTVNPTVAGPLLVNGITSASSGYYINYPQGQVVFNSPISTSSVVQLNYCSRYAQIYKADDAPWWREIQYGASRPDSSQFLQQTSGNWSIMGVNRVQLPAVVIEVMGRGKSAVGYEVGGPSMITSRDVQFAILAENRWDRNNLMDIINLQAEHTIMMYDTNEVSEAQAYPLTSQGRLVGTTMYPSLVDQYPYTQLRMVSSNIIDIPDLHPKLFCSLVKTTCEVII